MEIIAIQFASFHAICTESLLSELRLKTDLFGNVFEIYMEES